MPVLPVGTTDTRKLEEQNEQIISLLEKSNVLLQAHGERTEELLEKIASLIDRIAR